MEETDVNNTITKMHNRAHFKNQNDCFIIIGSLLVLNTFGKQP